MASALPKEQYYHGDDLVTGEEGQIVEDLKQDKGTLVTLLRIVSIILFMLLAMVSICSHLKCLGLHSNTDIYSQLPTPLTYASYAYCIWCLILTLQGLGALYALFPGDEEKIRLLWALNVCLPFTWFCEILWLFALTHGELGLAMTFLSLATLSLFFGYIRLMSTDDCFQLLNNAIHEANHNHQQPQPSQQPYQRLPRFLLHYALYFAPTSLNLSWLVLTSLSEFMVILAHFELRAHLSWHLAVGLIAAAFLFAIVFLLWKKDLPIPLAMAWGFLAIAIEQVHAERAVAIACFGGCALLAVASVGMGVAWAVLSCRRRKRLLQIQSLDAYHDDDDPWLGSYF